MTLEAVTTDALAPRHGFYTRKGGASSGVFAGLNCGLGSSDQEDVVRLNRDMVTADMGASAGDLVTVRQVHSAEVLTVDAMHRGPARADALVTAEPGTVLAILTADCAPVLFSDPEAGVIGAAHAGWKGALGGVLDATLDAMAGLGALPERTVATVGPTISQRAYEVGP
ncbi:MAG: polyphenol oxidase family protein, partial [Pseudomonadota bacterium]